MTRARSLKKIIRTRAAKTGESYTAARRHILAARAASASRTPAPEKAAAATPKTAKSKGAVSDERIRELTGHGLEHWFAVLDAFGAKTKGHTAAADHLYSAHGVPGWHAQGVTVAYERARGLRAVNQRCDGNYQVTVSKVVPVTVRELVGVITDRRRRARWLKEADPALVDALSTALDAPGGKAFTIKDDNNARFRYRQNGGVVELRLTGRPGRKTSIVADSSKLARPSDVEARRTAWRSVLEELHRFLSA
jgi:plasmid stability protein